MNRNVEQTILSLIPTHAPQLPPRLVDSARTLLVQSRQRAPTLKSDEEVARLYACAHLACERLKTTLNLPPIEPRPPIPPRVYKRLFAHLENILPGRGEKVTTPSAVRVRDATVQSSPALGSSIPRNTTTPMTMPTRAAKSVPRAGKAITLADTPSKNRPASTGRPRAARAVEVKAGGQPPWVRSTIAYLVNCHRQKTWGRFVLAGVDYITAPEGRLTKDRWVLEHMPSVVAAVFQVVIGVVAPLSGAPADEALVSDEGLEQTVCTMARARRRLTAKGLAEDDFWECWGDVSIRSIKKAMQKVTSQWIDGDWYRAMEDHAVELFGQTDAASESPDHEDRMRIQKPDTMHQERYNYLAKRRQAEVKAWIASAMQRIEAMERENMVVKTLS